jgi:hypothetical protein
MAEIEKPILTDENIYPDDKFLVTVLDDKMEFWVKLLEEIPARYPGAEGSWRYYKDGHNWLFKMDYKKKTLFWAAVFANTFNITFYFGDKAEPFLDASPLPQNVKDNFKTAKRYGAIRGISTRIMNNSDIDIVLNLSEIKSKMK